MDVGLNPFTDGDSSESEADEGNVAVPLPVGLYRQSSSAVRRMQLKPNHCLFCNVNVNRTNFENHLRGSDRCLSLYKRKLHVRSIDSILIHSFYCLFCEVTSNSKFRNHLEQSPNCLENYFNKFEVDSMRKVCQQIGRLKRESYKSRNSDARSKENKKRRQGKASTVSQDSALNNFFSKTAFSNIMKCIFCKCNKLESESIVLSEEEVTVEDSEILRRCQKNWKCKGCLGEVRTFQYPADVIPFHSETFDTKVLFSPIEDVQNNVDPSDSVGENQDEASVGEVVEVDDEVTNASVVLDKKINVSFPCSVKSLCVSQNNLPRSVQDIMLLTYSGKIFNKKDIQAFHLNQLLKYKQVESTGDRFLGKIRSHEERTLSGVIKQANDGVIHGSYNWKDARISDVNMMLKQIGEMAFTIEFRNNLNAQEVVASSLIQRGAVVTVSHEGNSDLQQERKYFVHTDHNSSVDCQDDCRKIDLSDFLTQDNFELRNVNNRDAPCYVTSVSQRLDTFIQEILKCQSSPLYSKEYFFQIRFQLDGVAIVQGVFWPVFLEKINYSLVENQSSRLDKKLLTEVTNHLEKAISCSSDAQVAQAQFELSFVGARSLVGDVNKFQVHIDENIPDSKRLPSLMTMICETPEKLENLIVSKRLLKWMEQELASLSAEELLETSTYRFLENLYDNIDESGELIIDGSNEERWKLVLNGEEFIFIVESKLNELMEQFQDLLISPFYHFALWCVDPEEKFSFVLKRLELADSRTDSYNPLFLKACNNSTVVQPCYGGVKWKFTETVGTDPLEGPTDHEEISFHEVLALTDAKKFKIRSSRPFAFVFSGPSKMLLMKKIPEFKESCFQVDGEAGSFYEHQQTIVSRYFARINGKKMLLSEFAIHYDYMGVEESEKNFEMLRANIENISKSDKEKSIIEESPYPDYIICDHGDVLKKRKKFKILKHPLYDPDSYDFKHSKVLLFYYPLIGLDEITEGSIDNFYESISEDNTRRVEKNEKLFLARLRKPE